MPDQRVVLKLSGLSKRFGAVQALDAFNLDVHSGEVHALVGENGAGKSTLINIAAGTMQPDSGQILLAPPEGSGRQNDLRPASFRNAHEAASAGIAAVFQELSLVGSLSVAENIFANRQPVNRLRFIRTEQLRRQAREFLELFRLDLDPDTPVERLSMAGRQVIEILKALSANPCVLLLDEPTSSLTRRETAILFSLVQRLREQGKAIIYVSHHLPEVLDLADRVTVLRDGRQVATLPRSDLTERELVRLMVGREIRDVYGVRGEVSRDRPPVLRVENLSRPTVFEDVAFELWGGEILGVAGLVGAGRTEVGRALFGAEIASAGRIMLDGQSVWPRTPADAMRLGISYVTENRKGDGLYLRHSLRDNLVAPRLRRGDALSAGFSTRRGFLRDSAIDAYAEQCRQRFRIASPNVYQIANRLSGGNQQKVLIAMWIGAEPRVLIADEPTRGVDVGARTEIYGYLRNLTAKGTAILLISSDLQEILGMADRTVVMRAGRIVARFDRAEATEEGIIAAALGAAENGGGRREVGS
ncbi:sugar ABC transporter ATP-binding protein [Candidatus Sumerlaeota bacterium]|nr:sugar ABC transporter ATP-binding protein [Candidatus Sumerlaeota bacterium]